MSKTHEDEMLAALGVDTSPEPVRQYTRQEERLIAGFEDIQRFVEEHGHPPRRGEDLGIFERLYAVRLDRLRQLPEARELLSSMDDQGLLSDDTAAQAADTSNLDEDALLEALGATGSGRNDDITVLKHVTSHAHKRLAEEIANREPCRDFERFQPLFKRAENELAHGQRKTVRFGRDTSIEQGNLFILSGQYAYVASVGEMIQAPNGERDARLRVIFANGTESNLLLRSLQRALYKDETGRRLSEPDAGPLFSNAMDEDDAESGTIYVLRSLSEEPYVAQHRDLIHKIGVTGGDVTTRIANAKNDPTYLLADVEIVATWKLSGIHRVRFERLLHRIFSPAQLALSIPDRFAKSVNPREWFLVPLPVIDEAVRRIMDGSITGVEYDLSTASLVENNADL